MVDPRTPDDSGLPANPPEAPVGEPTPVEAVEPAQPVEPVEPAQPVQSVPPVDEGPDAPQLDSFAAEPVAEPQPVAEPSPSPDEPVAPPAAPLLGGTPAAEPTTPAAEPTTPPPPVSLEKAPEPAPADRTPADQAPADLTLADEDPATPDPASSDPVILPPPPGTDDSSAETADTGKTRRGRFWIPLAAIGTAVALLTAGTGFLAYQLRQESRAEEAREDAKAAARDAARVLFSYNFETLDQDFERGLAVTTGDFRDQYSRTTKEVVTPVAEQYDAVVQAEVIEAAIVEADADEATAIVFLNQATTSTRVQGQQVDQSRVRMQLVLRDGRWLVEGVGAL